MARRKEAHGGGHGWFVTFADLMGLLVSFFVMLVAFSSQDQKKLQIVAGSMRDAFGVQTNVRYSGVIEVDGLPTRPKLKNAAHIDPQGRRRWAPRVRRLCNRHGRLVVVLGMPRLRAEWHLLHVCPEDCDVPGRARAVRRHRRVGRRVSYVRHHE